MNKRLELIKEYVVITFAIFIISLAVFFFLMPSHLSVGSISGLAIVLNNFIPLSVSAMTMIMNVALLIVGFILLGKEFGAKTVYTSILLPACLGVLEKLFPNNTSIMGDPFIDMICYVFVVSIGLAMLFTRNASSGGLDIVAKLLNKYLHMDLGKAIIIAGAITVGSSYFAYDIQTVVLGFMTTYFSGLILDYFIDGFTGKVRVCIISEHNDEFKRYVIEELERGITVYSAIGGYSGQPKNELCAVLTKKEYGQLMDYVESVDPNPFVTISNIKRVVGSWNTPKRRSYF